MNKPERGDEQFIVIACQLLLGRAPDPACFAGMLIALQGPCNASPDPIFDYPPVRRTLLLFVGELGTEHQHRLLDELQKATPTMVEM